MKIFKLFSALAVSFFTLSCQDNYTNLASTAVIEKLVFCVPFKGEDFEGSLSIMADSASQSYNPDSVVLKFVKAPGTLKYQPTSYLQIFSANYSGSKASVSPSPLPIKTRNIRNKLYSKSTNYIDNNFIYDTNPDISFDDFFFDYEFEIRDTAGRQSLVLGLFNETDEAVERIQVLVPPFAANPFTYKDEVQSEKLLSLHPFYDIMNSADADDEDLFLTKAESSCRNI